MNSGWIGVDLDGTLAYYDGWRLDGGIGEPIPLMLQRVKKWCAEGREVRIVTARAEFPEQLEIVAKWLRTVGLPPLMVTREKDLRMVQLWDDRCVQVEQNTGIPIGGEPAELPLPKEAFIHVL